MISLFLSIMIISQAIPDTTKPVLTWEPGKPAWGDTITFTYHHDAPDADFKGAAELTATFETESKQMVREGNLSKVSFIVPDSIHRVKLAIHTIET
ncbi:hypothetical protein GF359_00530, partial [candidate division WOR-3 bacterium]|nr:hypothetical protein [candidate division WOR-3 bacterium]MBD3363678.1 hypothetical protein [candidate division WOR-3 bacterium]